MKMKANRQSVIVCDVAVPAVFSILLAVSEPTLFAA